MDRRAEIKQRMEELREEQRTCQAVSDAQKLSLNGCFGKLSNRYSMLYTPKEMLRTTLTGQLSLLMLIEILELSDIPVVSANTDGVVIKCDRSRKADLDRIVEAWERRTNLQTEETIYKALYSRDVNNYIAVKDDGIKGKGVFSKVGLQKNPQCEIVNEAVIQYLKDGTLPRDTIRSCSDIRKFLSVRTVRGGAEYKGTLLGKAIRWYYSTDERDAIYYVASGNKVPKSYGAKPLMDLPVIAPNDIDYAWYEAEAKKVLWDIAALPRPVLEKIPRKNSKAWKALKEEGKIVEDDQEKWHWNEEIQHAAEKASGSCPVVLQQAESV